jgi:hypothetical protein
MKYILPFNLAFEPMERLAVISFKGHGEFDGFEPQYFDDPVNGKGMRLLRYRKNGKVDVYYEPGVIQDEGFSIGAGISDMRMTDFEKNYFEVTEKGLQVQIIFKDAQGRKNELKVEENSVNKKPVPFLAPIGGGIENPQKLFFVYMNDIDFVYRKTAQIFCSIDGKELEPATIPILVNGHRVYLARYCSRVNIAAINAYNTAPLCFDAAPGETVKLENTEIICDKQGKVDHIKIGSGEKSVELNFPGGFPNLADLPENRLVSGVFQIFMSSDRITEGQYYNERTGDNLHVGLNKFEKWQPVGLPLAYKLLTTFVKLFKNWPTYYSWDGIVELGDDPVMHGKWRNRQQ